MMIIIINYPCLNITGLPVPLLVRTIIKGYGGWGETPRILLSSLSKERKKKNLEYEHYDSFLL